MNDSLTHGGGEAEHPVAGDPSSFPTDAELARTLVAKCRNASLSTLNKMGYPYGSIISYADQQGSPILLVSDLAEHTINARSDARASLLVSDLTDDGDPLGNARLTLVGRLDVINEAAHLRDLYLDRHPYSVSYVDFTDFCFWKFTVESCRYVGGFGHMSWVTADNYANATVDPLYGVSKDVVQHMNDDHSDANLLYAQNLANLPDATNASMVDIDRHGITVRATTPSGPRLARVRFENPLKSPDEVRPAIIELLELAKNQLTSTEATDKIKDL